MKPKLLLADDSVTIRKVVELTFADEGIDVTTAPDGDTAMQKFVEIQPDIVLVDVGLPGTSGYQICEMIKQDEGTQHIPVLLLVGSFEPFDHDEAERINADGFLTKPFHSIRDLVSRVWDLLGREEGGTDVLEVEPDEHIEPGTSPNEETETEIAEPVGSEAETADFPVAAETSAPIEDERIRDIDQLYQSSLAPGGEAKDFDPVDEIFIDSAMDDQLIETFHPGSEARTGDEVSEYVDPDPAEESYTAQTKEFDWSPNGIVSTPEPEEPESSAVELSEIDGSHEPELYRVSDDPELDIPQSSEYETTPTDFDWSSRSIVNDTPESIVEEAQLDEAEAHEPIYENVAHEEVAGPDDLISEPIVDDAVLALEDAYTPDEGPVSEHQDDETTDMPVSEPAAAPDRASAELIELIAQRVIEKLSDNVIRDVAKEAVPRIAEKLIREALEEEKNR